MLCNAKPSEAMVRYAMRGDAMFCYAMPTRCNAIDPLGPSPPQPPHRPKGGRVVFWGHTLVDFRERLVPVMQ
eukprot:3198107-Pyramimonas_sp.AAC.1